MLKLYEDVVLEVAAFSPTSHSLLQLVRLSAVMIYVYVISLYSFGTLLSDVSLDLNAVLRRDATWHVNVVAEPMWGKIWNNIGGGPEHMGSFHYELTSGPRTLAPCKQASCRHRPDFCEKRVFFV